jgi:hypothetical protein
MVALVKPKFNLCGHAIVRTKARASDAWNELNAKWDRAADDGEEVCLTGQPIEECPRGKRVVLKFPDRLKLFLEQNGYPLT